MAVMQFGVMQFSGMQIASSKMQRDMMQRDMMQWVLSAIAFAMFLNCSIILFSLHFCTNFPVTISNFSCDQCATGFGFALALFALVLS